MEISWIEFRSAEPKSNENLRRRWLVAIFVVILVAALYLTLGRAIDNTNNGTANGLWKSVDVAAWEQGTAHPIDGSGVYYIPLYGLLSRLIPDGWFQFGARTQMVTFRKMSFLNGIFGALASALVFGIALRFTGSLWASCLVALAHAGAGFILLQSVNSEDIIPGYTAFLASALFFFEFLYQRHLWLLACSALFLALTTLLHWTLAAPALFGIGVALLPVFRRAISYVLVGTIFIALFFALIDLAIVIAPIHLPFLTVLLPTKASGGGWLGFRSEKILYTIAGIGNYFSGAKNMNSLASYAATPELISMSVTWVLFLVALFFCIRALFSKSAPLEIKCLALFALAVAFAAEGENIYSQPQDPQLQIQPMFLTIAGLIILLKQVATMAWIQARRALALLFCAGFLANGAVNAREMFFVAGADSRSLKQVQELNDLFPQSSTVLVSQGFELWVTWQFTVGWQGNRAGFNQHTVHLVTPFTSNRDIGGEAAAALMRKRLADAFDHGYHVVAASLWTEPPIQFAASLTTVTSEKEALVYETILRRSYRLGKTWRTSVGDFVELLPLDPATSPSAAPARQRP
jgi:hypothetical protein